MNPNYPTGYGMGDYAPSAQTTVNNHGYPSVNPMPW